MNRVLWNVEKSGCQKNLEKTWLGKLSVRVILDTYLWEQGSLFRDRVAKGEASSSKLCIGEMQTSKNQKNIFG